MDPHQQQQDQWQCDMKENQQAEEAITETAFGQEITGNRLAKDREPVKELSRPDSDHLRQFIPHQPVTVDTANNQ